MSLVSTALADPRRCTLPRIDQFDDLVLVGHSLLPCALPAAGPNLDVVVSTTHPRSKPTSADDMSKTAFTEPPTCKAVNARLTTDALAVV